MENTQPGELRNSKPPKVSWAILQILATVCILYSIGSSIYYSSQGTSLLGMFKFYSTPPIVMPLMVLVSIAASIGAVFRRPISPSLIRTTALWSSYAYLLSLPLIIHHIYEKITDIPPDSLTRHINPEFIAPLILPFLLVLTFFIAANRILKKQPHLVPALPRPFLQLSAWLLLLTGTLLIALGLLFELPKFSDVIFSKHTLYSITIGASFILIAHLLLQNLSLALTAPAIAAILVSMDPYPLSVQLTLERWIPVIALTIFASWRSQAPRRFRITAVTIPAIFLSLSLLNAWETETTSDNCLANAKPLTSTRPADFPNLLKPLANADQINYESPSNTGCNYWSLSYKINDPYPAYLTLDLIDQELTDAGFEIMYYSLINPHRPTSPITGWSTYRDTQNNPVYLIHEWSANWVKNKNEVVTVFLRYKYPYNSPEDLNTLHINVNYSISDNDTLKELERYETIRSMEKQ